MIRSGSAAAAVAIAAVLAAVLLRGSSINDRPAFAAVFKGRKDNSAEGVAKIRDVESMRPPADRLFRDPYAGYMYRGSSVQRWLGWEATQAIYDFAFQGVLELLTLRTKWIDDEIRKRVVAVAEGGEAPEGASCEQMIILGAGYDTRGFRLDFLPDDFRVIEIDQPEVQASKRKKLQRVIDDENNNKISNSDSNGGGVVGAKIRERKVDFVPIDFNSDYHLGAALSSTPSSLSMSSFDERKKTIVLLEGVTQYIPKSSTATALVQLREILPAGSVLLVSYVPEDCIPAGADDGAGNGSEPTPLRYRPEMCGPPRLVNLMMNVICPLIGEPWISGWTVDGFDSFLRRLGYEVVSDTTMSELNERYLRPLGRDLKENKILSLERYIAAIAVEH